MADSTVSALSAATLPLAAADTLLLIQGGTSKKTTVGDARAPDMIGQLAGFMAYLIDPAVCGGSYAVDASTVFAFKFWTPAAIAPSKIWWPLHAAGSGLSGFYTAFYDASDALIASTTSADIATVLQGSSPAASNILSGGGTISIPAGFFYLALKCGTGSMPVLRNPDAAGANDRINMGLTGTSAATPSTAPRASTAAGTWSGSTPPSTLGTLTKDHRLPPIGLRT